MARHVSLGRSRWSLEGGLRLAAGDARSARGISKLPPEEARNFYQRFDFIASPSDSMHLFVLLKDVRGMVEG
ncbi:MAG TPA: hypothetical protein VIC54_06875 [Terriglobales bacterium]